MKKTLITTFYYGDAVNVAILKFSPDKVILLMSKERTGEDQKKVNSAFSKLKESYGNIIKIEKADVPIYDIPEVTKNVCALIDKERAQGNEVILHMSESRKTQSFGVLFAGFIKKSEIKGVYYIIQEENRILPMPLLDFKLSATKKQILEELSKGNTDIKSIIKKTGKSKAMIYAHIQELKKDAYLDNDNNLTDAGKIMRG